MKKKLAALVYLIGATLTTTALAERTPLAERAPLMYVSIDGGISIVPETDVRFFGVPSKLEFDPGGTVGVEMGSQASENLRFGLSVLYNRTKTSSVRVGATPQAGGQIVSMVRPMWNFYYDLSFLGEFLRPYAGVGLGAAWAGFDSTSLGYGDTSDWGLAYAVHAGTHLALTDTWLLKVGYRFNGTGSLWNDQDNFIFGNILSHDFIVGVRADF